MLFQTRLTDRLSETSSLAIVLFVDSWWVNLWRGFSAVVEGMTGERQEYVQVGGGCAAQPTTVRRGVGDGDEEDLGDELFDQLDGVYSRIDGPLPGFPEPLRAAR